MADLTASDVTVYLSKRNLLYPPIPLTFSFPVVAFGNGVKNYPAGGVPMPGITAFGLKKGVAYVPPAFSILGYVAVYDITNNKIRIYQSGGSASPLVELGHVAVPALSFALMVFGDNT